MPRKGKKGGKRGKAYQAGGATSGTTVGHKSSRGTEGKIYRFQKRMVLTEAAHPIGTVRALEISWTEGNANLFTQSRILRLGIELNPMTYAEFIVRSRTIASLDTRAELVTMQDCVLYNNLQGAPHITWYRPTEAMYRGWLDIPDSKKLDTGLWVYLNGQNSLIEGTGGMIGALVIDYEMRGLAFF